MKSFVGPPVLSDETLQVLVNMKITIKNLFPIAVLAGCIVMTGCCTPPDGYTVIRNHPRFMKTHLDYPSDTSVLRFAATRGLWESDVMLEGVVVRKGTLTFMGSNGSITFTAGHSILIKMLGQQEASFPLCSLNIRFHLYETPLMECQSMIEPHFMQEWFMRNGKGTWNYSPRLTATFSNNFWLIDIPVIQSPDFDGDAGTLNIIPPPGTWGNFQESCSKFAR